MTAGRVVAAIAALLLLGASAHGADGRCSRPGDDGVARDAAPSEVQVLWSRKSLTYANTTEYYAACSYRVGHSDGGEKVETYLKPGQSVTRRGVSGIVSNPANCTIFTVRPCNTQDRWGG